MSRARTERGGFTLLEMIVATAIMAILAGSLYATLHTAFRARRSATTAVEETRTADLALAFLQADLESTVVPTGILAGAFLGEPNTDASGREADALLLHATAPGGAAVEGVGDIRQVEFVCEPSDDGTGLVLVRRVTANLLAPTTPEPLEEVLCRNVFLFALRYYDGIDWLDTWDSTQNDNQLPAAVEVTLQLRRSVEPEADEEGYRATRLFLIPNSTIEPGVTMEVPLE
jgi:prepilin-type N-terminal cleavage/methylation domain-containing protein